MLVCYPFKLKYLNQKRFFYPTLKKYNFFLVDIEYILKGFKSHIEKIKYSSSIYIANFENYQ